METFGELINRSKAEEYFKTYNEEVKTGLSLYISPKGGTPNPAETDQKAAAAKYNGSTANAFIFSRDIIERLLSLSDKYGKKPEYLMILPAAHPKSYGNSYGEPTHVILGCNKNSEGDYHSMLDEFSFSETPGKRAIQKVPEKEIAAGTKTLIFTVI
jgi:hypothetical protein